jgi:nucleotide-binding universal stress UspA family protein
MLSTVIVATDGSAHALDAATRGLPLLRDAERVIVVAVIRELDDSLAYDGSGHAGPTFTEAELREHQEVARSEGEAVVADTVAALRLDAAETRLLEGNPGQALCAFAEEIEADAIVMGSRGRGGFKRALLGSVSDHVVRHARCPVLIVGAKVDD